MFMRESSMWRKRNNGKRSDNHNYSIYVVVTVITSKFTMDTSTTPRSTQRNIVAIDCPLVHINALQNYTLLTGILKKTKYKKRLMSTYRLATVELHCSKCTQGRVREAEKCLVLADEAGTAAPRRSWSFYRKPKSVARHHEASPQYTAVRSQHSWVY
jgi:hypothetical protein